MTTRRPFVPAAPNFSALEERLAPTNIFGLGTWWDHRMGDLGLHHYKHHAGQSAIIGSASPANAKVAYHPNINAKSPVIFK